MYQNKQKLPKMIQCTPNLEQIVLLSAHQGILGGSGDIILKKNGWELHHSLRD